MSKKGLAGGYNNQILDVGASWSYIWYPAKDRPRVGYEHVPIVMNVVPSVDAMTKLKDCQYWLFFNEPDYYSSNPYFLKPQQAAMLYREATQKILVYRQDAKFIVGGTFWPNNLKWLDDFRVAYANLYGTMPNVHGWHVHNYAERDKYTTQQWRDLLTPIQRWLPTVGGGEFWLTEFGCLNSTDVCKKVMKEQVPWLENQSWVTRYAWWTSYVSDKTGSLFVSESTTGRTELGTIYANLGVQTPPPWRPPPFINGVRRYKDSSLSGCQQVLEYGYGATVVSRYVCHVAGDHVWHGDFENTISVEWLE